MRRLLLAAVLALPAAAQAACPSQAAMDSLAEALIANRPSPPFTDLRTLEEGFCAQERLVAALVPSWGRIVGYKVGLTSAPVQSRFGVNQPLRGYLMESSISLRDGAEVPARFGAVPVIESDFLVRVRDAGINTAGRDHVAILRHLDAVIPYIELPDLVLTGGFNGPNLLAINVGARLGVVGTPIPVEATQAFADRLANMTVTMVDDRGQERARAPGTAALGHPLNVVAFLVESLASDGMRLEPGQVISVAGYSPTLPLEAGRTYTVRYEGLAAQPVSLSVRTR
jgi:2-keto-4-pentenoate hydratase